MFLCCFGPRRPSTSSIGEAITISRNPFNIDLVVEVMLEEADVRTLKTLREMTSNWNKLDLKELEKRAEGGQLKPLDFSWEGCPDHGHALFFKSTAAIPQLFRSFCLNFPNSFKFIHSFFPKYTPIFLHLEFHEKIQFTENVTNYLCNFFSWISPSLQELRFENIEDGSIPKQITDLFNIPPANGAPLVFHKLTKIIWDMGPECDAFNNHIPFNFILDKSGDFDPTPNLTTLEACINLDFLNLMNVGLNSFRWSQLTNLRILERCDDDAKFPATLLSLGQAGMCLKFFALAMSSPLAEASPDFWRDWSHFFATQAKSLQVLEVQWTCGFDKFDTEDFVMPKIRLPIFESLHTLHFYFSCEVSTPSGPIEPRIFEMGGFQGHFPKVVHMRVNEQGLLNIFPVEGEPVYLKSLIIHRVPNNWQAWTSRIRSVESLKCKASLFSDGEADVPWKESLKELVIDDVRSPIKVSHLASLRKLIVREWILEIKFGEDPSYLTYFQEVLPLKLSEIIFDCYEEPSDEDKARFNSYFSAPVKFQPIQVDQFPFYHYAV